MTYWLDDLFCGARAARRWEWAVLSEDGTAYVVGTYRDGEYCPGSFRKAVHEWRLLRRDEPRARIVRKARRLNGWAA